jgi:hypothetical protein
MKLTDNWCIKGGKELAEWITKYEKDHRIYCNAYGSGIGDYYWLETPPLLTKWDSAKNNFGRTVITVSQLEKMIDEKDMPKKWAVKRTPENAKVVNSWFDKTSGYSSKHRLDNGFMHYPCTLLGFACDNIKDGYTEITFEQFSKITKQEKTMEKKIIGWRLKKDCEKYRGAANKIIDGVLGYKVVSCDFVECSQTYYLLQQAGVLDLWFEPVYEEEKLTVGGYEVKFEEGMKPTIDGHPFSIEFWQAALEVSKHSKASVTLGCDAKGSGSNQWKIDTTLIEKILAKL